jgi:hypothetical protein
MTKLTTDFRTAALRRGIIVATAPSTKQPAASEQVRLAATVELANLGFVVKPLSLREMSTKQLTELLAEARVIIGADRAMTPVYPGFPKQVEELSSLTLLVEQLLHYWSFGTLIPDYPEVLREELPLADVLRTARELTVLPAAAAARELIHQLATAPVGLSVDEKTLLKGALALQTPDDDLIDLIGSTGRHAENLQTFAMLTVEATSLSAEHVAGLLVPEARTADALLRLVIGLFSEPSAERWAANYKLAVETLSDGNARAVRSTRIPRSLRRLILKRLGEVTTGFYADGLVKRQELWRRVLRALHAYDFALSDSSKRAADIVHSNGEYRTLNSLVEAALAAGDVPTVVSLLSEHNPGELLRRGVAILRSVSDKRGAVLLAQAVETAGAKASLTTLISAYNGIISANDEHTRVTRVAGLTNTLVDRREVSKVSDEHISLVLKGIEGAIATVLAAKPAPVGAVGVASTLAVPLVRRDASTADRVLDRGQELAVTGEGDILRLFGHWRNTFDRSGYMDIGVVLLDEHFNHLAVATWDTHTQEREWSTYSGDMNVYPGDEAAEYFDVKLNKIRKSYPGAKWAALTVQSWSGWPIEQVDFIAGAMLRSGDGQAGNVFDARTVTTAFKPTTGSTQAVPLAVNLDSSSMVWLDASSGSTSSGTSSSGDSTVGTLVYDEVARPRLTMGTLAGLWAEAHGAEQVDAPVDRAAVLALLG